jgi:hypothetical protein
MLAGQKMSATTPKKPKAKGLAAKPVYTKIPGLDPHPGYGAKL